MRTPEQFGSGFLIAPDIVITNHHVIGSAETARKPEFQFYCQLDRHGKERTMRIAQTVAGGLFHTSSMARNNANADELDYAVIQVEQVPENVTPLRLAHPTVNAATAFPSFNIPAEVIRRSRYRTNRTILSSTQARS